MNRKEVKELLPVLQAFAEGKTIQVKTKEGNNWDTLEDGDFEYLEIKKCDFRVKPEPKYRPFKDTQECWQEMRKHQPFGWVKDKGASKYCALVEVENDMLKGTFTLCTFADGTPFGVKEEVV